MSYPDSGQSADIRHSDQEGFHWETLKAARKFETPEEKAIRLGYLPHEEAVKMDWPMRELFSGVKILFGLRAQGHMPTVERMLAEGKTWDEIGTAIGWHGSAVKEWYERFELPPCMRSE